MASRAVVQHDCKGGRGRRRKVLNNISNCAEIAEAEAKLHRPITRGFGAKFVEAGKAQRPITRAFGAKIAANAQNAEKNKVGEGMLGKLPKPAAKRGVSIKLKPDVMEKVNEIRQEKVDEKVSLGLSLSASLAARSKAACGLSSKPKEAVVDIDAFDVDNELAVVEYVEDIYKFYKESEHEYQCTEYIDYQPEIDERMRANLVDWLIEVHDRLDLFPETLYLTINLLDRFLSLKPVLRTEFKLVGIGAMLIACKYEQTCPPEVNDFVAISESAYTYEQILKMEEVILGKLEWYITVPTLYMFLCRYIKASVSDNEMECLVYFLAELSLMNYDSISYRPSMVAASAIYVARHTLFKTPVWTETLRSHTGYSESQLVKGVKMLLHSVTRERELQAVYKKYSRPEKCAVALCPPYKFMSRYIKGTDPDNEMEYLVYMLTEHALMNYDSIRYCPSMVAASAVYVAQHTLFKTPVWTDILQSRTGFSESELIECAKMLVNRHSMAPKYKYSKATNYVVALCSAAKYLLVNVLCWLWLICTRWIQIISRLCKTVVQRPKEILLNSGSSIQRPLFNTPQEVAKEASDMVLADDNFSTIVAAVSEGRSIYNNMKAFIRYMSSSIIGDVASIFLTAALGIPEGLTPVQLLWVNLVTDGPPATALGFSPPDKDIMKKPSRKSDDSLINAWILFRYLVIGLYIGLATVGIFIIWYTHSSFFGSDLSQDGHTLVTYSQLANWGSCRSWGNFTVSPFTAGSQTFNFDADPCDYFQTGKIKAMTLSLSVLVAIEMFNSLNALSEDGSLLSMPLLLAMSVSFGLHFLILYVPFLAKVFGIVPLSLNEWLLVLIVALPVILIDEVLKFIGRSTSRARRSRFQRISKYKLE